MYIIIKYALLCEQDVKVVFDYEENQNISQVDIDEVKKKISKLENSFDEKLTKCLEFLEQHNEDYFEIHMPVFDYGITIMMSKLRGKFLVSVLDQRNSKVYGNLLLGGYDCIDMKELKKLGSWSAWGRIKASIFKPDQ